MPRSMQPHLYREWRKVSYDPEGGGGVGESGEEKEGVREVRKREASMLRHPIDARRSRLARQHGVHTILKRILAGHVPFVAFVQIGGQLCVYSDEQCMIYHKCLELIFKAHY